jgi:hypothetical protein
MYNSDDALRDLEELKWLALWKGDGHEIARLKAYILEQRRKENIPELLRSKDGRNMR